ncbi:diguanylate cyclase response regulator [Cystobacter fuscus]|uniref:diguanylate cyclase n=1 Tax=Cystobacter fuscus TaxID=43 RepID=A0A250IXP3_9BACT|nr:diguanylate cyclase [Cystobacter fuscus]ATB35941.1 diguanylate cyclase response regulator [Cystobacter fuscus]
MVAFTNSLSTTGRVLLVDDSIIALETIGSRLKESGLEVAMTTSPLEALALATEGPQLFDLLIVDVMMPQMNGHELTRQLRGHARTLNTPILLLTSLDSTDDRVTGLKAGADDFFTKTAPDAEMIARVRSFISLGKMRAQLQAQHEAMARVMREPEAPLPPQARVEIIHHLPVMGERLARALRGSPLCGDFHLTLRAPSQQRMTTTEADLLVVSYPVALEGDQPLLKRFGFDEEAPAIIVVDEVESTSRRVSAFDSGADDYLTLNTPMAELIARMGTALRRQRRQSQLRTSRDRAMLVAVTDPLTGLYNRAYFHEALGVEFRRAQRYKHPMTLVLLDLDHFKQVNDTLGHTAGDQALREVSTRLRQTARSTDVVARHGGEEFAMILPETDLEQGLIAAERFRAAVEGAVVKGARGGSRALTISAGVGCYPAHASSVTELIELIDAALYKAKRQGRNRVCAVSNLPEAPAAASAPPPASPPNPLERLRRLVAEDLDGPLSATRTAARMLHEASAPGDSLHILTAQLRQSSDAVRQELLALMDELSRNILESRRDSH